MSLVFAALTPHPPLLIPSVGREEIKQVEKTKIAMEKLEEELYLAKPDIILVISPHGTIFEDAFTLNACPEMTLDFKKFGDLTEEIKFRGDTFFATTIRSEATPKMAVTMISEPNLDHGVGVPLFYLTKHLPNVSILPIGYCALDLKTHWEFGSLIKDQIMNTNKRVAVIASGDLSHALKTDAPAGYNAAGSEFDEHIRQLLASGNSAGIMQIDPKLADNAAECGLRSLVIMLGILKDLNVRYQELAYEAPFGVGYLTANFGV